MIKVDVERTTQDIYDEPQAENFITKIELKRQHNIRKIEIRNEKTAQKSKSSHVRGTKYWKPEQKCSAKYTSDCASDDNGKKATTRRFVTQTN